MKEHFSIEQYNMFEILSTKLMQSINVDDDYWKRKPYPSVIDCLMILICGYIQIEKKKFQAA